MLPNGWQRLTLGECVELLTGHAFSSQAYTDLKSSAVRLLRGDNVMQGSICWDGAKYWPLPYDRQFERYEMLLGDIVIAMDRPITNAGLKCSRVQVNDLPCLLVQRVARIRTKGNLDQGYLAQLLQTHSFIKHLKDKKTETAVPHISPNDIRKFSVVFPAKNEQCHIANILATWDQAIASTEKLIENSLSQKKLLAQRMLTGKVRLQGFSTSVIRRETPYGSLPADWAYLRIGEVAVEVSQKLGNVAPYPVLSCTKHHGLVDSLSYFNKQVFSLDTSTYKLVPRGCFVYATNHIDEGSIGYQDLYDFGLVSPMYTSFKTNDEILDSYLFALLKTEHYRQIFASATNASVDRRGSLRWKNFRKLHIPIPSIDEQRAIANILMLADRDANLMQRKLDLLRKEKSALMAQLLTGKRRVHLPDSETAVQV